MTLNFTWTHEMLLKLIDLYQERPLLWDTTCEDYKQRFKKMDAWQEMADIMGEGIDRNMVEKKVRMLAGQYRRELVKESTGARSKWFAFSRLRFLGTYEHHSTHSSSNDSFQVNQEYIDTRSEGSTVDDSCDASEESPIKEVRVIKVTSENPRYISTETPRIISTGSSRTVTAGRYGSSSTESSRFNSSENARFSSTENARFSSTGTARMASTDDPMTTSDLVALFREEKRLRDEYAVFGEHVAHKLRKISNTKARARTQYLINQILFNAEMGKYDKVNDAHRATSSTASVIESDPVAVENPDSVVMKLEW